MADPLRAEEITLRDGRKVVLRRARMEDAESAMRNVNRIGRERIYIMVEEVPELESERRWLEEFDGVRTVLLVAGDCGEVIGAAECRAGAFPTNRAGRGIGMP